MSYARRAATVFLAIAALACASGAWAADAPAAVLKELATTGRLRAAINYGNPVLAQRATDGGAPRGVSADLARELARRLAVEVTYVEFDSAGVVSDAVTQDWWDVAFLAIDPKRAEQIAFSAPYVLIEGAYLVRASSALQKAEDVDRPGVRVAAGRGSTYDLFLTRELKQAQIVRAPTSPAAVDLFLKDGLEVCAGVRQPLEAYARAHPETRVLAGRFMVINQAVATPKARTEAARYIQGFVEEMKTSGFVARSLAASGQTEATVAPAAR